MNPGKNQRAAASELRFIPTMLEPELQQTAFAWPVWKRRRCADIFERWVVQLRQSADLAERAGLDCEDDPEAQDRDAKVSQKVLKSIEALPRVESLEMASRLEALAGNLKKQAEQIRFAVGFQAPKQHALPRAALTN
jgi:hypothetical protein